ncbi:MAG: hypothetical protein WAQ25_01945 [Candidatus Saccharimonas sp.]
MAGKEPTFRDDPFARPGHIILDPTHERERNPLDKLREFQALLIRERKMHEILRGATSIPDLEAMARQSTDDLGSLLASRQEKPLEGGNRQFSFLELGARDDELNGMAAMQDILHGIFDEMYGREALGVYQQNVPYDPIQQTHEAYSEAQYAYARDVADRRCAVMCPSVQELVAKSYGQRWYELYLQNEKPNRQNQLPF